MGLDWYRQGLELLVRHGRSLGSKFSMDTAVSESIERGRVSLRPGMPELLRKCINSGVALIVVSAGIAQVIERVLERKAGILPSEYTLWSNRLEFDSDNILSHVSKPLLHMYNKTLDGKEVPSSVLKALEGKKHFISAGDSLGDGKIVPVEFGNVLRVGLLNVKIEENRETYRQNFDLLYEGDYDSWDLKTRVIDRLIAS